MAVYRKPKKKYARRFGMLSEGASKRKGSKRPKKKSDFGARLEEKQRIKFIYKILERQLRRYVENAFRGPGDPGEKLLRILEMRLDNVVYRLGFTKTRSQARQLVGHGHILVDGKKIDIPSYEVNIGEIITVDEKTLKNPMVTEALTKAKPENLPPWLKREENEGTMDHVPAKDELRRDINISYIIEFYS